MCAVKIVARRWHDGSRTYLDITEKAPRAMSAAEAEPLIARADRCKLGLVSTVDGVVSDGTITYEIDSPRSE